MPEPSNRRDFLVRSATLGAALGAFGGVARGADEKAADAAAGKAPGGATPTLDRIVVGVMGTGGRGTELATEFATRPGTAVRYVCDVDENRANRAAGAVEARLEEDGIAPKPLGDFRRILDDKDVDVVVIAACDHWHAPAAILACAAGKHVYVEKPCCHNPREGELLVQAARKHNRVVQHGTQRRSWPKNREAIELVRGGEIGRVLFSRGWYNNIRPSIGHGKQTPPPAKLDFTLWQGPAPEQPFRDNILHYNWHWFWHWGTGECGNNGVHALDVCRWGLSVDYPRRVTAGGGRYYYDDDQETPDTHSVTYDFGDRGMIVWEGRSCHPRGVEGSGFGIAFYGDAGTLVIDGGGYRIFDPRDKLVKDVSGNGGNAEHIQDFLDAVRSGGKPHAEIEEGYKSALLCHLGNIAWRTGRTVNLDPQSHRPVGDPGAEALWRREYREGWEPKV
jgi:predicted dehydrogenase